MGEQAAIDAGARALWVCRNRNAREPSSPGPDHIDRMMATVVLEAAAPLIAAAERERVADPRDFGLDAKSLHRVADQLYDVNDERLEPLADVSVLFGRIRSRLRSLADAIEDRP